MGRRRFGPHGRPGRLYCRRMRECATFWWALRSARGWDRPSPPSERALTITGAVSDCHALHDDGGWCPACAPEPTPEREPFQPLSIPPFMARSLTSLTTIAILWRGCGVPKGVKSGPSPPRGPRHVCASCPQTTPEAPRRSNLLAQVFQWTGSPSSWSRAARDVYSTTHPSSRRRPTVGTLWVA